MCEILVSQLYLSDYLFHIATYEPLPPKDLVFSVVESHFVSKLHAIYNDFRLSAWEREAKDDKLEKKQAVITGDDIVKDINYWLDHVGIVRRLSLSWEEVRQPSLLFAGAPREPDSLPPKDAGVEFAKNL